MVKGILYSVFLLLFSLQVSSQSNLLDAIQEKHDIGAYKKAREILLKVDTTNFTRLEKSRFFFVHAVSHINIEGEMQETYKTLLKAKKLVGKKDLALLFEINDELIYSQYSLVQVESTANELMDENCLIAQKTQDPDQLIGCNSYRYMQIAQDDPLAYEKKLKLLHYSRVIAAKANLYRIAGNTIFNIAATHEFGQRYDSALFYYEKSKSFVENKNYIPTTIVYYSNLGYTYIQLKRYDEAIESLRKALELSESQDLKPYKSKILMNLGTAFTKMGDFEKSSEIYQKVIAYSNEKNESNRFNALQELETKYQVQERKLENAELNAANERQKVWIIATAGSAFALLLIGGFVYNNQRKKRRIALQEIEIERQRADNLMKNQELATIDAMIAGQEKERKKLASELHDDLGSSLTTIRLYFENLKNHFKEDTSKEIYTRTDKLLEETYATIRSMSHSRHNGVLASKGLIPTVQKLAQNLTDTGKIKVSVYSHDMDRTIENSLELNIFRMIQELLSNVVKHAGASVATVNIIGSKKSINLMVEDNGKGFEAKINQKADGMGLYSIEKRVEEMDGTMDIDSSAGHGTTITIEIPII
ncbi:hypothetical protein AAU57_11710 [Nonlabens sp. YIK11]|uniref:tetratricopeptide repeat-containing sensor histidine kinase n=1 Tax=Nonlabens sp. YIK11 TaxID=1453349 RepID=UPI0006DD2D69|nr:tetratricopeptide repeat-containing sensor histidine kinase [Nonlabens sp. YIK11]KQC33921.1 hypothetical protein AAU57_11710 [Nonlabens sp. YIK11]